MTANFFLYPDGTKLLLRWPNWAGLPPNEGMQIVFTVMPSGEGGKERCEQGEIVEVREDGHAANIYLDMGASVFSALQQDELKITGWKECFHHRR